MANPTIVVDFKANTADLNKGLSEAGSQASGFGSRLKGIAKGGAIAAGAAGVGALVATLKIGVDEFAEAQKVGAQTESVIKSTGGAARVTADHVGALAGALTKKSGVDDEAIQSGENLLLTFTNIHNEAGKGNDIFDQATGTMLDMSVALGQDMSSSAVQLGKALNDPIKGITALSRVGVSFTASQKEQIAAMVEAGDTMGAQKVILAELNKEFGGSAEALGNTLPGQISIVREAFNNFAGDLVGKLIPYVTQAIGYLRDNWPQISAVLAQTWTVVQPILAAFGEVLKALGDVVIGVVGLIRDNWGTIGPIVQAAVSTIVDTIKLLADILRLVAALLRGDWAGAWKAFQDVVSDAVKLIKDRIDLVLLPIKAILDGLWSGIKAAASAAWDGIKAAIMAVVNTIKGEVQSEFNAIKNTIETVLNATKSVVQSVWNGIKTAVTTVVGAITAAVGEVADAFKEPGTAAESMLGAVKAAFAGIAGAIRAVVGAVGAAAQSVADAILHPIEAAKSAVNAILSRFNALSIPGFNVTIPVPGPAPDIKFGWGGMELPDVPLLAKGGIVSRPTLAMVGEGHGREIVSPENLLRDIVGERITNVRVFIGDRELTDLVRTEVVTSNTALARTLLAGTR